MMPKTFRVTMSIFALTLFAEACTFIFPKTADLEAVHDTYRREFTSALLPSANELGGSEPKNLAAGDFKQTLAAIADYRRRYPETKAELNHLKILEGMIYLQTKQFGMAQLSAKDVQLAGGQLSSSRSAPRDRLFAETYENLLNGWRTINDFENQENPTTSPATLITAAEGITQRLCNIKAANSLKTVEGDQGASYLATSAAIFYLWADHRAQFACLVEQDQGICDREYYPAVHLDKGRDLVWEFMSSTARQFAEANLKATKGARIQGAPRFAEYYLILEKNINERASKARAANRRGKAFVVTARAKACVEGM